MVSARIGGRLYQPRVMWGTLDPLIFRPPRQNFLPRSAPIPWIYQPPLALSRVARIFITSTQQAPKPYHQCLSPLAYLSFQLWSQKYVSDIYISSGIFTACISNPFLAVSKSWMSEFTLHSNLLSQNLPQFHLVQPTHRIRNYESANFSKLNWFIFVTELYFATNLWVWIQLPSFELLRLFIHKSKQVFQTQKILTAAKVTNIRQSFRQDHFLTSL